MGFSAYFLFFKAERVFAILFSYLKEPQLIVANFIPGGVTAQIVDTETLEEHFQKEGETQSYAMFSAHYLFAVLADGP